jgi:hypothetical protein
VGKLKLKIMDLKQEYREETNLDIYVLDSLSSEFYISIDYVKWLEDVIKSYEENEAGLQTYKTNTNTNR